MQFWTLYRNHCECNGILMRADYVNQPPKWGKRFKLSSLLPIICLISFRVLILVFGPWQIFLEVGTLNFILSWTYQMSSQDFGSMSMSKLNHHQHQIGQKLIFLTKLVRHHHEIAILRASAACNNERLFYHVIIGTCFAFVNCNKPQVWRNKTKLFTKRILIEIQSSV